MGMDLNSGKGQLIESFQEALDKVIAEDETYFFIETKVARREIFNDYLKDQATITSLHGPSSACRLTYSPEFKVLEVPFGLVTRKNATKLQNVANEVYESFIRTSLTSHLSLSRFRIEDLTSSGLLSHALEDGVPKDLKQVCRIHDDKVLGVMDLATIFVLVCVGFAVSIVFLLGEFLSSLI